MDKKQEAFGRLLAVMDELREKCPWDREQTFESLKNNTIEETYELIDAINDKDYLNIRKELGDLLLHVVFYAKIGEEQGRFDIADVSNGICEKLIFRHPHVFGDVTVKNSEQVTQNWEVLKQQERKSKRGLLSGVPKGMPAMVKAYRLQEKTSAVGFDWNDKQEVWAKVQEEIGELQVEMNTGDKEKMESELGDVLFALTNAARLYGINPESALERTNRKFISRFNHVEARADETGADLKELTLSQMDLWWNEAKQKEAKDSSETKQGE